jgi:ligand-binding sensor domain-containing protein
MKLNESLNGQQHLSCELISRWRYIYHHCFLLLVLLYLNVESLVAQSEVFYRYGYKIEHYAHTDGVFKSEIAGIAEDKDGYLWFSNVDYLVRYDGYDFTRYKLPKSLLSELGSSNYFHSITPQNDGRLFLTTFGYGRLLTFDPQTKIFTQPSPDGENGGKEFQTYTSYNFLRDDEGKYWTGTMAGLVHFDLEGVRVIADTLLRNDANSTPFFGQDSILYCATDSSLYRRFDQQGAFQFKRISTNTLRPYPESIAPASNGGIWLGGAKGPEAGPGQQPSGLYKYDIQENKFIEIQLGIELETRIKTILETPDGNLWIGTYGTGLYRLSPPFVPVGDTINSPNIQYIDLTITGTSNNTSGFIWDLVLDRQNNLWVGTRQKFLYKITLTSNNIKHVNLRASANLPQEAMLQKLFVDSQANSWVTVQERGIIRVDGAQSIQHFDRDFYGVNIEGTSLYPLCEQEEIIWFGGEKQLIAYHKEDAQARVWPLPYNLEDEEYIIRMLPITTTKMILLTHIHQTIDYRNFHLDIKTRQMVRSSPPDASYVDIVSNLKTDQEEGFWVMEGLGYRSIHHLRYEDGKFDTLATTTVSSYCSDFAQDTAGDLWVASVLGFYHLDMQLDTIQRYDEENGLVDSFIKDVEVGPDGNIWLQSGYGLEPPTKRVLLHHPPPWYWAWWSKLLYVLLAGGATGYCLLSLPTQQTPGGAGKPTPQRTR